MRGGVCGVNKKPIARDVRKIASHFRKKPSWSEQVKIFHVNLQSMHVRRIILSFGT